MAPNRVLLRIAVKLKRLGALSWCLTEGSGIFRERLRSDTRDPRSDIMIRCHYKSSLVLSQSNNKTIIIRYIPLVRMYINTHYSNFSIQRILFVCDFAKQLLTNTITRDPGTYDPFCEKYTAFVCYSIFVARLRVYDNRSMLYEHMNLYF